MTFGFRKEEWCVTSEECIRHLTGYDGKAKFINKELVDLVWTPSGTAYPALMLGAGWIREFPRLMRFLRAVEKAWLEIQYGTRLVANDGLQLWIEKKEGADLEATIPYWAEIYEERYGMKPNILVVSENETADTSFWKGKVLRVSYLLPIHFRLSYQVEDAKETE